MGDTAVMIRRAAPLAVLAAAVIGTGPLGAPASAQSRRPAPRPPTKAPAPRYVAVQDEVNVGSVTRGQPARFVFTIKNTGNATLTLKVIPNCSCTVPTYDSSIAPGKTGTVTAMLNTIEMLGEVTKTLSVRTNDPRRPAAGLYMIANVISLAEVLPSEKVILPLKSQGVTEKTLTISIREGSEDTITAAQSMVPGMQAILTPMPAAQRRNRYQLTLRALETMPPGETICRVVLRTSSTVEPEIHLTVRCRKGIIAAPRSIALGVVPSTPARPLVRMVTLTRTDGEFKVLNARATDPNLRVTVKRLSDGPVYRITLTYTSGWPSGIIQRLLIVETDDPAQKNIMIPILGRVEASRSG